MLNTLRRQRHEDGFTLIELLIVIVVLGILASIVVFAVGTATDDAETSACDADIATLNVAMEAYKAKNGAYPATEAALVPNFLKKEAKNANISGGNAVAAGCTPTP